MGARVDIQDKDCVAVLLRVASSTTAWAFASTSVTRTAWQCCSGSASRTALTIELVFASMTASITSASTTAWAFASTSVTRLRGSVARGLRRRLRGRQRRCGYGRDENSWLEVCRYPAHDLSNVHLLRRTKTQISLVRATVADEAVTLLQRQSSPQVVVISLGVSDILPRAAIHMVQ